MEKKQSSINYLLLLKKQAQDEPINSIRKLRKELWGYDWPDVNNMFEQFSYWPMAVTQMKTTFGDYLMDMT